MHASLEDTGPGKISLLERLLGRTREASKMKEKYVKMLQASGDGGHKVEEIRGNISAKKVVSYKVLD